MAKKFYAVRQGRTIGIFKSWEECKKSVDGYSGAEYKSFSSEDAALAYLHGDDKPSLVKKALTGNKNSVSAYVDGSYDVKNERYSYGCVIIKPDGDEVQKSDSANDPEGVMSQNIAGELQGALFATKWAIDHGYDCINIYHDLEGTSKWASKEWKAKVPVTENYVSQMQTLQEKIMVKFHKVKGHSNDHYNDMADSLAKSALRHTKGRSTSRGEYWFTANGISYEEISTILKIMMEENENIHKTEEKMPYSKRITIWERKEKVTIHHYTTKENFMIQGKPNKLFSSIITYLNELCDLGDTTEIYRSTFNVDVEKRHVEDQCRTCLPYSYNRLPTKMLRSLHQAVLHLNLKGDFFESSFLVFPALRVLEGHLKNILFEQKIIANVADIQYDGFSMFKKVSGLQYELDTEHSGNLSSNMINYLGRCYSFFRNHRHSLFHWDDPTILDTTTVIENTNDAHNRIRSTLTLIDEYYKIV